MIIRTKITYTEEQYNEVVKFFENENNNSVPNIAKELGYRVNLVQKIIRIYFKNKYK